LRARCKRPRKRGASDKCDEIAPFHGLPVPPDLRWLREDIPQKPDRAIADE